MNEAQKAAIIADKLEKLIDTYELNALRKGYADLMAGKTKHQVFIEKLTDKMKNIYEAAKSADIDKYMFEDVTEERNRLFGREPQWSLKTLFSLTIPDQ